MAHTVTCQHCRIEVPTDAAHCPNCGQPMPRHLLVAGEVIGEDYQIVKLIGYGGMGEVYLAQHHLTGQQVAIKVLAMHLAEEVDLRIRFLDEARILARLDHPNIVMLHNFKQDLGRMLILMQYVDGEGLDLILSREGPMHPERASLIFAPLCDALYHAHEHGIVHRDLKPSNILVDRTGKARLTDFGIAKLNEGGAHLTRTGTRVGTSWFMSPEQGLNRPADARSDIYALGVTFYNALSGRLPFYGESEYEIIKGHVEHPPPPIYSGDHPLAGEVEAIVMRALAKRPEERFQSALEMRDCLLDALSRHGETDVRGAGGTGVFAIHMGGAPSSGGEAAPKPRAPNPAPSAETRVDPVLPVPTPELRQVTPSLGQRAELAAVAAPRPITQPMPTVVPEAAHPPERTMGPGGEEIAPARLRTPAGRPAAPGKVSQSTGILVEPEVAGHPLPPDPAVGHLTTGASAMSEPRLQMPSPPGPQGSALEGPPVASGVRASTSEPGREPRLAGPADGPGAMPGPPDPPNGRRTPGDDGPA